MRLMQMNALIIGACAGMSIRRYSSQNNFRSSDDLKETDKTCQSFLRQKLARIMYLAVTSSRFKISNMASFIKVIGKILDQADRDLKQLNLPGKIKKEYERIDVVDHDGLQAETQKIRRPSVIIADDESRKLRQEQLEDVDIELEKKKPWLLR